MTAINRLSHLINDCPVCANSFSLIAALVPICDGAEGYVPAVVNQLS